jgi:nucleotide-binding universal stress UspA family protein
VTRDDGIRSTAHCEPFRSILVGIPSDGEETQTQALALAIALAQTTGSAVSLYVFAPHLSAPLPMSAATATLWLKQEVKRLEKSTLSVTHKASEAISSAGLEVIAEHAGSPFDSRSGRFVQLARVHDLVVLDAADISDPSQRTVIEDVLFDSGCPLLVVPRDAKMVRLERIAIAWDGSARSARAVKDALPFLVRARTVVAVTVAGEKDLSRMAPGADLAMFLARHGVECKLAMLAAEAGDVAERLRSFVASEGMEMIIMGAFVHSRFRQAMLGGVTRSLLEQPPVTLFLAH